MKRSILGGTRLSLAGGAAILAMVAGAAYAQETTETVTVSSTRLQASGFEAPTPTTVIGIDQIERVNKPNLFDVVNQIPSMFNSNTAATGTHGTSGGDNGTDAFNMFGLGAQRTLTLLDGQRYIQANAGGFPDIGGWPHLLVQRVDVVTGGASASWGSDALSGVVNFVTDKKFVGFKGELSGGVTTYGDNVTLHAAMAAGTSFLSGRGHAEVSFEYDHSDGLPGGQYAGYGQPRSWYQGQRLVAYASPAATPAGQPQNFAVYNSVDNQRTLYGMINSGPLQGTAFQKDGTPYQVIFGGLPTGGAAGVPNKNGSATSAGTVANCITTFCIGGDTSQDFGNGIGLAQARTRGSFYGRLSYDITDDTNVWTTVSIGDVGTQAVSFPSSSFNTLPGIAANANGQVAQMGGIQCGLGPTAATLAGFPGDLAGPNAYLPAVINQACISNNIRSFGYGDALIQAPANWIRTERVSFRIAVGADGTANLFGDDWAWHLYYTHGQQRIADHVGPITLLPYLDAAVDAVAATAGDGSGATPGAIVCRNATARAMGCVPINIFGGSQLSQSQLNWIYGGNNWNGKHLNVQDLYQDAASFSVSASPFSLWAGKVAIAAGLEYRQEVMDLTADGAAAGNQPGSYGAPAATCVDPLLNCIAGNNWYAGNFHPGHGNYHVSEGFVEFGVPLLDSPDWGRMDLQLAGRYEMYAPAGTFATWKAGLNWDTPLPGVRLRTLMSRDVHTPTLSDLYAPLTTAKTTPFNPWTNTSFGTLQQNGGNNDLKPERSINTQIGLVYTPDWLNGLSFSVDYYRYALSSAIGAVDYQTAINQCFAGLVSYCASIVTASGQPPGVDPNWTLVKNQTFNLAGVVTDGFSYQATYDWALDTIGMDGDLNLRASATNVSKFISTPGLPGTIPIEAAGSNDLNDINRNTTSIPHWVIQAYQTYTFDDSSILKGTSITLAERFISQGQHDRAAIACIPGSCPVDTLQHQTINNNHVPGIIYFNLGVTHNVTDTLQAYVQIDNLLNKDPPPMFYNNYNTRPVNWQLYDVFGRMINVGVRIKN
jgi:outer membrane receptor protein involved in Fe transport